MRFTDADTSLPPSLINSLRRLPWWKRILWAIGFWFGLCLMFQVMIFLLYLLPA